MRYAYRWVLYPGMIGMVVCISGAFVLLFAIIGTYDTTQTLLFHQRLFFHSLCGIAGMIVGYPPAVLTLYVARVQTRTMIGLALAVQCLITAVPGAAIPYTLYTLFHEGKLPNGGVLPTYVTSAATLLAITAITYYVLCLMSQRRSIAMPVSSDVAIETVPDDEHSGRTSADQVHTGDAAVSTATGPPGLASSTEDSLRAASKSGSSAALALEYLQPHDEDTAHCGDASENPQPAPSGGTATKLSRLQQSVDYPAKPRPNGGLLTRIPSSLGHDLVYIKVSGHYLEVVTTLGSAVIVQRFSDAVAELGDRGLQTHRSYWVAHEHIRRVVRRDHRTLLQLNGGYEVPVSRTFLPAVHHLATTRTGPPTQGSGTD